MRAEGGGFRIAKGGVDVDVGLEDVDAETETAEDHEGFVER